METTSLIRHLAASSTRVRRLWSPERRAAIWLTISLPYVAVITINHLNANLVGGFSLRLALEESAIMLTAITAAFAAFASIIPGYHSRVALLPALPLAAWLASLGEACVQDWIRVGETGLQLRADWDCLSAAILIGAVPLIAMFVMLRRGAPLVPRVTLALGTLAAAALVNLGLRVFHFGDISIMVLVWHFGGIVLVSLGASQLGPRVLIGRSSIARLQTRLRTVRQSNRPIIGCSSKHGTVLPGQITSHDSDQLSNSSSDGISDREKVRPKPQCPDKLTIGDIGSQVVCGRNIREKCHARHYSCHYGCCRHRHACSCAEERQGPDG